MLLSKQNEKYVDRFLDHFFGTFLKKVEIHIFHPSRFALVPCAVYLVKLLDNTCRARWPRRGSCVVGDQNWTHETSITAREAALFWFIFSEWSLLDHFWTHETSNTAREAALFWFKKWLQHQTSDIRQTKDEHRI